MMHMVVVVVVVERVLVWFQHRMSRVRRLVWIEDLIKGMETHLPTLRNSSNTFATSFLIFLTFFSLSSRFLCNSRARKLGLKPNQLNNLAAPELKLLFGLVSCMLVFELVFVLETGGGA